MPRVLMLIALLLTRRAYRAPLLWALRNPRLRGPAIYLGLRFLPLMRTRWLAPLLGGVVSLPVALLTGWGLFRLYQRLSQRAQRPAEAPMEQRAEPLR